jgi:hypothetical protein
MKLFKKWAKENNYPEGWISTQDAKKGWRGATERAAKIATNHICDETQSYHCDCGDEIAQKILREIV